MISRTSARPRAHGRKNQPMPRVTAVVPNYNGIRWLSGCLDSLQSQKGVRLEIVVVDDASTDRSAAWIQRHYPHVQVLALEENLGFAGACNAGVAVAKGDYVALVNNDTLLPPGVMSGLAGVLALQSRVAVVSPRIDNMNMDMTAFPRTGTLSVTGTTIQNVIDDPAVIFGAPGACLMFRKSWGTPFDADYRFFHEDVYLSWNAWFQGFTVATVPELTVRHLGSATVSKKPGRNAWLTERNRWLNALIFWSGGTWFRLFPLFLAAWIMESGADLAAGRGWAHRWKSGFWLATHIREIFAKRRAMQIKRRAGDEVVLRVMSCKLTNSAGFLGQMLNAGACWWCRLVGIRTWEMRNRRP